MNLDVIAAFLLVALLAWPLVFLWGLVRGTRGGAGRLIEDALREQLSRGRDIAATNRWSSRSSVAGDSLPAST